MSTITGLTAARMLEIEAASIVDGDVVGDNLIFTKHDGTQIDAGSVRGPQGTPGPPSSDVSVISATPVLDVGIANQIRAGRNLLALDFTNIGSVNPNGLWNLFNLSDVSGNGRSLSNKGAVGFAKGITGVAGNAAQFIGSSAQALYIADTGVNDPFRIKVGTWGCWFRTAKRDANQVLMSKWGSAGNQAFISYVTNTKLTHTWTIDGTAQIYCVSTSDIADDCWHFAVFVHDGGAQRIYVDGVLEAEATYMGSIFQSSAPFNIGANGADGSTAASNPFFGRIDEAFITGNVLNEDQIRNLYCAKIPHGLGVVPSRVSLNVRRQRRGGAWLTGDFDTAPLRMHNFSAGSLADSGSQTQNLTNNGAAVTMVGADGRITNGFSFNGTNQSLSATDTGLPAGTAARSYGCWFRTTDVADYPTAVCWGTTSTGDVRIALGLGFLRGVNVADILHGPFVADSRWHLAIIVEDNSAVDGLKRKMYLDGKMVDSGTTLSSIILGGATSFRIACDPNGTTDFFPGQIDGVFVCGYALTPENISSLYAKGGQSMAPSPKNVGDHVEAISSTDILAIFDTLESCHQVDLGVGP